jgi:hypothetical protein
MSSPQPDADSMQKRRGELERLRRILPPSEQWEKWLDQTGELPPDFDAMASIPDLPDPLRFQDGREISDQAD